MYYATPEWISKQIPQWMWSRYEIYIAPYGTTLSNIANVNPKTTALIGFSAGGIDVLKNYNQQYKLCVLLDPSTRSKYALVEYGSNTLMFYNAANWGTMNKSLTAVANRINETGGNAMSLDLQHADLLKYFFAHFKSDTE